MGQKRSGRYVLSDMDEKASRMRGGLKDLSKTLSKIENRIEALQQDKAQAFIRLSEIRMDILDDPDIITRLSAAENEARNTLDAHDKARTTLDKNLEKNQKQQKKLEQKRDTLIVDIETAYAKTEEAKRAMESALLDDKTFLAFDEKSAKINDQILRIDAKIELARIDYKKKSKPYYADELFIYLSKRRYGTSSYRAMPLIRTLDKWVSDIAKYETARRDYAMLSAIPGKLIKHKGLMQREIEDLEAEKQNYKKAQLQEQGITSLQQAYVKQRAALDDIDQALETLEKEHRKIMRDKTRAARITDKTYNKALSTLHNAYKGQSLHTLRQQAILSATPEDDQLIDRIERIDQDLHEQENLLSTYTRSLNEESRRLDELQNIRKTYKKKRYDVRRTTFEDDSAFERLLGEKLSGVLSNRRFWRSVGHTIGEVLDDIDIDFD